MKFYVYYILNMYKTTLLYSYDIRIVIAWIEYKLSAIVK